jgi:TRAP-type C4-dicarboxylate transport system permease large subunit
MTVIDDGQRFVLSLGKEYKMLPEILLFILMMGIMIVGSMFKKVPMSLILIIAAVVGALCAGLGFPVRAMIEGTQQFFSLMLVVATGMLFMGILKANGALDALATLIVKAFYRWPVVMLSFMMLLIMLPGMLTGSAPAAVLSTGMLCVPIFLKLGIPKEETGAIVALGALYGMIAPPINVPAMIISTGVYMPYEGFAGILCAITIPLAIFSVLFIGKKFVKKIDPVHTLEGIDPAPKGKEFTIHLPMLFIIIAMVISRMFPTVIPDIGTSGIFFIGTIIACFTGKRINVLKASKDAMVGAIDVLALFAAVGVLISIFAMNGVRGLMVYVSLSMTGALIYLAMAVSVPILSGPLMPFGAAAVLGVPFIMATSNLNSIMVTSGLTMLMGIGALMPPTAISGQFAQQAVGIEKYGSMIKKCIVPIIVTIIVSVLVIVFAQQLGQIF